MLFYLSLVFSVFKLLSSCRLVACQFTNKINSFTERILKSFQHLKTAFYKGLIIFNFAARLVMLMKEVTSRLNHSFRRTILWTLNSCLFTRSKSQKVSRDFPTARFQQNLACVHQALLLAREWKNSKRKICHDPIPQFILM